MRGAEANLRGRLAAQIPPDAIDAGFSMAGDRPRTAAEFLARLRPRSAGGRLAAALAGL